MDIRNTLLEDISAEIGYTATSALCGWYGGREIRIPINFRPDHRIALIVGPAAFRRLVESFGGESLFIPKDKAQKAIRLKRIVFDMFSRGASVAEVCARTRYSKLWVVKLRQQLEEDNILPMILTVPVDQHDAD